jgi:hypothetical protein
MTEIHFIPGKSKVMLGFAKAYQIAEGPDNSIICRCWTCYGMGGIPSLHGFHECVTCEGKKTLTITEEDLICLKT